MVTEPTKGDRNLYLTLLGGALLRLSLVSTNLSSILEDRNEFTTPITSWARREPSSQLDLRPLCARPVELTSSSSSHTPRRAVKEGHHILSSPSLHLNPYHGGSFHHPPLLLLLGPLTTSSTVHYWASHALWTAAECGTAYALAKLVQGLGRKRREEESLRDEGEKVWEGATVAALYLFHPFAMGASLARSTSIFTNFFIAMSLSSAVEGSLLSSLFSLSLATHLSLYPALLLPPLTLFLLLREPASQRVSTTIKGVAAFVGHQALVLGLSRWMMGDWTFLSSVYGVILTIPDLTPTIGLGWYFFIEMFDHFREFFVAVFQLHVLIYVAPLTYAFRQDPLFAILLMVGIIAIFKSYPSLGDFALWHALLGTYSELVSHLHRPLLLFSLSLYSLFLLPSFHHLWLYSGSGNANFFYASTLVWTISQGGLLVDILGARGEREVKRGLGEEGRKKVREGKWKIVQR